jgi:hypothetical protein
MTPGSPLPIVLGIIVLVSILGGIIALWRNRATYSQYEDIKSDVRELGAALRGEVFRDGGDLVISGTFEKMPIIVRFSHDENTPAVNVRMTAPTTFNMSVVPKGSRATEGRVVVRTGDDMFDARFVTRTDHPTQAKMFLAGGKLISGILQRLCCSSQTYFTIGSNALELSELAVPANTARHLLDHIRTMGKLQYPLRNMPHAEAVKLSVYQKERKLVARAAIAVGLIAAVVAVVAASRPEPVETAASDLERMTAAVGDIPLAHSSRIPNLQGWRLAGEDELRPVAQTWLRNHGVQPKGSINADLNASGAATDAAYMFVNLQGERRVVIFNNEQLVYDATFEKLDLIAPVTRRQMQNVEWETPPVVPPGGDGLLLVRDAERRKSGIVLFLADNKLITATPADVQEMNIR